MNRTALLEVVRDLRERVGGIERSHRVDSETVAAGSALAQILPGKELEWGTIIEWLSSGEGAGAATLALAVTAQLLQRGGALVVVDSRGEFYPPAAAGLGIPLESTVIVRPQSVRDVLWTWEQSLRCSAVAVALGWIEKLSDRAFRRLQLAAEKGSSLGFLLRPVACRTEPSWAQRRMLVEAVPGTGQSPGRRLRVELLHCRGGASGEAVELELRDETGHVRLLSRLAHPTVAARAAGA